MVCFSHLKKFVLYASLSLLGLLFGSSLINVNNFAFAVDDISVTYTSAPSLNDNVFPTCTDRSCLSQYSYLIVEINSPVFNLSRPRSLIYCGGVLYLTISPSSDFAVYSLSSIILSSDFGRMQFAYVTEFPFSSGVTFTLTENYQSGITPSGSLEITQNGTYDVTQYAEAVVNVPTESAPVTPDGSCDYTASLEAIRRAILTCGAILLLIYFFYCIYRIIIKSTGGN